MNKIISILTVAGCMGVLTPDAWCQAGKFATQLIKKTPYSALDILGSRFAAGEAAARTQASLARTAQMAAMRHSPNLLRSDLVRKQSAFNTVIAHEINPTPIPNLRPRLVVPSLEQTQEAVQEYMDFFTDFKAMRHEVDPVLGNALLERTNLLETMHPSQLGYYTGLVRSVDFRLKKLQKTVFSTDPALAEVETYLNFAESKFNKFYTPDITPNGSVVRPFVQEEFWMEYDWHKPPRDEALTALPENVHMAVLNDTEDILDMYKLWEQQGRFPKGWKVSTYDDTMNLLNAVKSGQKFDLIISDINVPGGGGRYFVHSLREMGIQTPVIGCSGYTRDKIDSEELFLIGFDGYMYSDDMFEESSGFYKWKSYISNYYYYQRVGGWPR